MLRGKLCAKVGSDRGGISEWLIKIADHARKRLKAVLRTDVIRVVAGSESLCRQFGIAHFIEGLLLESYRERPHWPFPGSRHHSDDGAAVRAAAEKRAFLFERIASVRSLHG